jgi:hypothetical protein
VAALRYITNNTYLSIIREMLDNEVAEDLKPLKERVAAMTSKYEEVLAEVKEENNLEKTDFVARRLYEMTADIIMSLLILDDATRAPELFAQSAQVYVRHAEAECAAHYTFIKNFKSEDLESYRQA